MAAISPVSPAAFLTWRPPSQSSSCSASSSSSPPRSSGSACAFVQTLQFRNYPSHASPFSTSLHVSSFCSSSRSCKHVRCSPRSMAPDEEKMTRRSPLDFPIEWERPRPGRRPDIFPQFSPMKTPLPQPPPTDPPEEDEEEEKKEEEEKPEEEPDTPPKET
ncbi:hypothetical protein GOP47_0024345 [Adiantum capillus-veneris]|uniref:Uncharacterized protein n=1 Tax=Adiantum capillus-veneris TaxID=13818 RepID=A0A9D4U2U5_ADICA|nr:hypothetical protein GOP47_0024345 [Adiantum capillus-veneris]